ncbi:MAG TPA: hypothetical protein VI072_29780 [Polyangiaceae bacterium]
MTSSTPLRKTRSSSRAAAAVATAATGASWMALLAATTLGIGQFDRVRAAISSDQHLLGEDDGQSYRLIVQSYASSTVFGDDLPSAHARPLGSVQRAVTAEELAAGVQVDIVQIGEGQNVEAPVVVAWIERGEPDLEFDARRARPTHAAFVGSSSVAEQVADTARVVLKRRGVPTQQAA